MIVLLVVSGVAPTVAAAPSLSVTVDGTSVQGGESITVTDDPRIGIEASGDATIESVEVRVDGETRHSFQPGSESFSESPTVDLDDGEHEVTVVAEGSGTTTRTATVVMDSDAPEVSYTSPFTTDRTRPSDTVTIEEADTRIAGELYDRSGVQMVRIERNYEWKFAGQTSRDRTTYRIEDPGENFSRPILFGLGENSLRVELIDVHGQRATHDITVNVVDDTRPSIDIDRFERSGSTLEVAGVVSDNVKVESLGVRTGSGRKSVLTETSNEPNPERIAADFEFSTRVSDGAQEITLIATDVAGNTRTWDVPLDYRGHLVPTISIDREATQVRGDSVAVSGTVTDGRVTRVVVETVGPDGSTLSTATVHEGEVTDRVPVRARLPTAEGETTVVVRAVDADGREHEGTLTLDTGGEAATTTTEARATTAAATTAAPSTPAATTAAPDVTAAAVRSDPVSLGVASTHLPVPAPVPFPLSIPLPVPFAGSLVVVAVLGLAMAISGVTATEAAESATAEDRASAGDAGAATAGRGEGTGGTGAGAPGDPQAGRRSDPRTAGQPAESAPETAGHAAGRGTPASGPGGRPSDRPPGEPPADEPPERPGADGSADDPAGSEAAGVDGDPEPEPAFDVTDHLDVASVADVDADDVATLADRLDADDAERVANAARGLADVAGERPELIAGTEAESRLRDLRLDPDPDVSDAASTAVRRLADADG